MMAMEPCAALKAALMRYLSPFATSIQHHCMMLGSQMVYPFMHSETDQL